MGQAVEVAKALAAPAMKLLDMVGGAIGTAYEPRHQRKMADATAYEISVVGEAMRNAADMPIVYNKDGVAINSEDFNRLMQRAGTRMVLQETIKQHNIESVIDNAYKILENEKHCSEEPVEQGWTNRFFDSVADISDEDLQKLWGEVLAGEIKQPKSYSLRTLETLKNLSKHEAEMFAKIAPYIIKCYGDETRTFYDYFLLLECVTDDHISKKMQVNFSMILDLSNAGLISSGGLIYAGFDIPSNATETIYGICENVQLLNNDPNVVSIRANAFILSTAGKELLPVVLSTSNIHPYETYMKDCWQIISQGLMSTENLAVNFYTV